MPTSSGHVLEAIVVTVVNYPMVLALESFVRAAVDVIGTVFVNQSNKEAREEAAARALHQHFGYNHKPDFPNTHSRKLARVALEAADKAVPVEAFIKP